MKKLLVYFVLTTIMFIGNFNIVFANTDGEECTTRGPSCNYSRYYVPTTNTSKAIIDDQGTFVNNTSLVQSKTFTYSTTLSSNVSSGIQADLDMIGVRLGATASVAVGTSSTKTRSTTLNFPTYKTSIYKLGHLDKITSGRIETLDYNCVVSSRSVSSQYSYQYYDSIE